MSFPINQEGENVGKGSVGDKQGMYTRRSEHRKDTGDEEHARKCKSVGRVHSGSVYQLLNLRFDLLGSVIRKEGRLGKSGGRGETREEDRRCGLMGQPD